MQKITLTVKDYNLLKSFFNKFNMNKFAREVLITFYNNRIVARTASDDGGVIKISTLDYKDVFEESELDMPDDFYILPLMSKMPNFTHFINTMKGNFKLTLESDKVNVKTSSDNYLAYSSWYQTKWASDGPKQMDIVKNINFTNGNLRLKLKASEHSMISNIFKLSDSRINIMTGDGNNTRIGEVSLDKDKMSKFIDLVNNIEKSDVISPETQWLTINTDAKKSNINFKVDDYFDFDFPCECKDNKTGFFNFNMIEALDLEGYDMDFSVNKKMSENSNLNGMGDTYSLKFTSIESNTMLYLVSLSRINQG